MLAGCEDYLDVKPRGYDVAEKVSHYEGLLYGTETIMLDEVFPYMCFEWETNSEAYENVYSLMGADVTNAYKWEENIFRPDENCLFITHFSKDGYAILAYLSENGENVFTIINKKGEPITKNRFPMVSYEVLASLLFGEES